MLRSALIVMQRNKPTILLAATLAFAIGPFLVPDFSGFEPNQYPNPQDEPPIQPATYAFGIWILIYLWLIGSAVFGLLHRRDNPEWEAMRWPMIISLVIGAAWLPVADRSPVWAMVMIFAMLISALVALKRTPVLDPLWTRMPIGLYAGWLTAASFSGLGLLGAGYGVIFDETGWAYTSLQAAMLGRHWRAPVAARSHLLSAGHGLGADRNCSAQLGRTMGSSRHISHRRSHHDGACLSRMSFGGSSTYAGGEKARSSLPRNRLHRSQPPLGEPRRAEISKDANAVDHSAAFFFSNIILR